MAIERIDGAGWPRTLAAGLALRRAREVDQPFLFRVYAATRAEELAPVPWPEPQKAAFLAMQAHAQHADYARNYPQAGRFVIERNGAGIGRLYLDRRGVADHVLDIALLPAARGQGFGGALLEDLIEAAGAAGRLVSIYVERMNPARRLYTRLGFRVVEEGEVYDLMHRPPGTESTAQENTG